MRVIGTAGHVDHGKSTLIAALTGTHPDRLKEEQDREMTIELGFGWMTLPNGEEVGIVDVPGHRDFIENMLSGIGGIDAALLIIAADEGIMPQTKEHLAILDLLGISTSIVVLTKTDLASDSEWLDLVETDIRAALSGTILNGAPIVRVSAKKRSGLEELIACLQTTLREIPARPDLNRPRLPVDRVFSMSGFGIVVTGTLKDGHFLVGDDVEILPEGLHGRIRGLQTHKKKEEMAVPGSRVAVNISGLDTEQIQRGNVITHPGQYWSTRRLDAHFRLLKDISRSVLHGQEIKFFSGASEAIGILRLLGKEELLPGDEAWIQLELREPVVVVRGDHYILQRPSPGETLGGGIIVDHNPKGRHKRFDEKVLAPLESILKGSPSNVLFESAMATKVGVIREIVINSRLEPADAESALRELVANGSIICLEDGKLTHDGDLLATPLPEWTLIKGKTLKFIDKYHAEYPLRRGIPREELKSRLKLSPRVFAAVVRKLIIEELITDNNSSLARAGFEIRFNEQEQAKVQALMRKFDANSFAPPSVKDCQSEVGMEIFNSLVESGTLVTVSPDVVFRKQDYDLMMAEVRKLLAQKEKVALSEVRDQFNTSRKYAQAFLEHLDSMGVTQRDGDFRKLRT